MARGFERVAATVYGESQDDDDDMSDFGEADWLWVGKSSPKLRPKMVGD